MVSENNVCWKCGASIEALPLPLSRLAACDGCGADLHSCKMCSFYDTGVSNQCREPIADVVSRKEVSNFCGYFQLKANAYQTSSQEAALAAKATLSDLFGGDTEQNQLPSNATDAQAELNKLFGIDDKNNE